MILTLWRAHFNATLNGDDTNNPENEMIRPSRANTLDNTTPVAQPDWEEVAMAIQRLKLNKASLSAERPVWEVETIRQQTDWFLSVWFQTWQINHRPDLYATPNLGEDTG